MYILGINNSGYDTSCALMKDGKIICAICEERLIREKRTKNFPLKALNYCLDYAGISMNDISHIAVAWNPGINLERMYSAYSEKTRFFPELLYALPNYLIHNNDESPLEIEQIIKFDKANINIHYYEHHFCHAAFSYYTSSFNHALILSIDAWGEKASTLLAKADKGGIEKIWTMEFPQSLGMFYQSMTEFLGFTPQGDEWKLMGASSYGDKDRYRNEVSKLLFITDDGKFEMDLSYFDYMSFTKKYHFSEKMIKLFGLARLKNEELTQKHFDLAAAVQHAYEEIIFHILNSNSDNELTDLCLSGGGAMNCVANGKINKRTRFKNINISFAPDDAGTSIGACFLAQSKLAKDKETIIHHINMTPYLSKDFSDQDIEVVLDNYKLSYEKLDSPAREAASYIADGKILGWFQGAMEFGQRALGNRSILADARNKDIKDLINKAVKYREAFRPFAPAILDEYGDEFFQDYEFVPYMEKVLNFKPEKKNIIPAVYHTDGTGRIQSVSKELNPLFWQLIDEFRKITQVPLILNTSFNLNGEPIVHSVKDAVRTFCSCGLDILIIGRYLINK